MHEVEVSVLQKKVPELRSVVIEIGRDMGQRAMYFDASPIPTVEIINTETGLDEEDEEDHDEEGNDCVE